MADGLGELEDQPDGIRYSVSKVWELNSCNASNPLVQGKTMSTWQPIDNEISDDVFQPQPLDTNSTDDPPLRFMDIKSHDAIDPNNNDDAFFQSFARLGDVNGNNGPMESPLPPAKPPPTLIRLGHVFGDDEQTHQVQYVDKFDSEPFSHSGRHFNDQYSDHVEVTRRQIVSIKPHIRTQSMPESSFGKSLSVNDSDSDIDKNDNSSHSTTLEDITKAARMVARPLLRNKTVDLDDTDEHICRKYNFISNSVPPIPKTPEKIPTEEETCDNTKNDYDSLSEITAMTRKSTRPTVGSLDFQPSPRKPMRRTKSVTTQVVSPTVPALSPPSERPYRPPGDRTPLSARSYSSSGSSISDYPFMQSEVDPCFRCGKTVYQLDKMGPIRKVLFHKLCFKCCECGTTLNVNNYFQNTSDKMDASIYCKKHKPATEKPQVTLEDRNLSVIMNHPKLNTVHSKIIRGTEEDRHRRASTFSFPVKCTLRGAASMPRLDMVCDKWDAINESLKERNANQNPWTRDGDVLKLEMDEPRSMWTRSVAGATALDLGLNDRSRNISHFYDNGNRSGALKYL